MIFMKKTAPTGSSDGSGAPAPQAKAWSDTQRRLALIDKEFKEGLAFISQFTKSVTIFGSSMLPETSPHCVKARELGEALAKAGYAVVTGGGPAIMEAANRGAFEAGGKSVGLNITLPTEQEPNPYLTDYHKFYYFFARKMALVFGAEAYVIFPGGFGTLNEFFEIASLIETERMDRAPIFLVGNDYWKPLDAFMKKHLHEDHKLITDESLSYFTVTEDVTEIVETIKRSPVIKTVPFPDRT